jgi:uncharacterized protein (TIGR00725 family)
MGAGTMRKLVVGVIGTGDKNELDACAKAFEIGQEIARSKRAILLCGGRGGVMQASAKGALDIDAAVGRIGIHPGASGGDSAIDCMIYTKLGDARNYINAHASDVLIALKGGWGTLSEISLAFKNRRHVVLLEPWLCLTQLVRELGGDAYFAASPKDAMRHVFAKFPKIDSVLPGCYPDLPGQADQKRQFDRYVQAKSAN